LTAITNFAYRKNSDAMKRSVLTSIVLIISAIGLHAEGKQYIYNRISHKDGLTSTVNCIYKEKDGDVWIGTPAGLYNFNGYMLKPCGENLFGSRKVFDIGADSENNLWVVTEKHILRKDRDADTFTKVSEEEHIFFCMTCDDEDIWFGSRDGLFRYTCSDKRLSHFCTLQDNFDCRAILILDDGHLLCSSHNGKMIIDTETAEVTDSPFGTALEVSASLIDSRGQVWIAYYNKGIEVYEKDGTLIKSYNTDNSDLSNDIVLCLAERGPHVLAGTDGGGINIIDSRSDEIHILSHVSGEQTSFPAHSIKSLFADHYGTVWAGSIRDGVISISQSEIKTYKDTHIGHGGGLSNPTVLCFHQDRYSGNIWIGTDGEGMNMFDPKTSRFTHIPSTLKKKVVSIADYSENELAISVYSDNILTIDKKSGKIESLELSDESLKYLIRHSGRSVNLCNEKDGDLILFADRVYRYDKSSGTCRKISVEKEDRRISNFLVIGISDEGIWMHNNNSIYLLEDDSDILKYKGTHKDGTIRSGYLTTGGIIWLATEEGLCSFNTVTESFVHIPTTLFKDATSVICDNRSRVWIGTEKGLSAYLTESGSFALFGESDGVEPNEYLPKPRLLADNGDVYMGGVQGLLRIGSGHNIETSEVPGLTLEYLTIDGQRTRPSEGNIVKAPRNSKSMEISISVHEKDLFREKVFRFTVSDMTYETSIPVLSMNQIPRPGTHDISVSCTRRNGEWTEPVSIITLKVPQPWYASWWFIMSCLIFASGTFILSIYTINRRKSNQLQIAVKEQEQKIYEEKVQMLINISHELRTPLTLITAPLKRLLKTMDPEDATGTVLNRIYRQSRRMRNILDMVLDLRKMEVGGSTLKTEKTDFNRWIEESADDIVNEEKAEGIDIIYNFDPSITSAEMDRQKCDTILMNILINAIKHSGPGDRISISTMLTEGGMIRTSVSDQGPGLGSDIDPEKMFTRFYQSKNEKYGSGIGLSYSRILVEMHGGTIGAYNNPDKGATFWWEIPVCAISGDMVDSRAFLNELLGHSSEAEIAEPAETLFNTSGMRLMLVDDNKDLLDFLREALCTDFSEIITVTGGQAALSEINSGKLPDIIVSDVNMPEGDGFWLCNQLKTNEKYSHIPIVLLTARGEDNSQSESYRLGADGFLAKPFEVDTLMELIRNILKNKSEIRRRYLDNEENAEADYGSNEENFIIRLNRIIADNMNNPSLDQQLICRELGVSRALLYNKMKAITGAGAKEYITKIRIEKAKSLIENTSLTIAEISDMTGFASQSYFSTAFKNYEGVTPTNYKHSKRSS